MSYPTLRTVDSHFFMGYGYDGNYQYGYRYTNQWSRWEFGNDAPEQLANFLTVFQAEDPDVSGVAIKNGWVFGTTHFAAVRISASTVADDVDKYWLCSSTDSGVTWTRDFVLGDASGTHLKDVYILDRGICLNKQGEFVFGEYTGLQKGSEVRVVKGTPGNWEVLATFNEDVGGPYIDHIHSVISDPFSNDIYIGTGDSINGGHAAALIRWDGTTSWPTGSQLDPSVLKTLTGFGGFSGLQRYRVIDLIFTPKYIYSGSDTTTVGELGIWRHLRGSNSEESWENLYSNNPPGSNFWGGAVINNRMVWMTNRNASAPVNYMDLVVYDTSDFDGDRLPKFLSVGRVYQGVTFASTSASINGWFVRNDKLYISVAKVSGSTSIRQGVVEIDVEDSFDFNSDPHTLLPKVWVSNDGTDSEGTDPGGIDFYGCSSRYPFKTLQYIFRSTDNQARITHGHSVEILEDLEMSTRAFGNWVSIKSTLYNGNATDGPTKAPVELVGSGDTVISYVGGTDGPLRLDSSDLSLKFLNITVLPDVSGNYTNIHTNSGIGATWILGKGAVLGSPEFGHNQAFLRGSSEDQASLIMESGSAMYAPAANRDSYVIYGQAGYEKVVCKPGSKIYGGRNAIRFSGGELQVDGLTVLEYGSNGGIIDTDPAIYLTSGVVSLDDISIKNVAASSTKSTGSTVTSQGGLTFSDASYDYCITTGSKTVSGGNSHGLYEQEGLFSDSDGSVGKDSVLVQAGDPGRSPSFDFKGDLYLNPPTVGGYEIQLAQEIPEYNTPHQVFPGNRYLRS